MVLTEHRACGLGEVRIEVSTVLPLERGWTLASCSPEGEVLGFSLLPAGTVFRGRHPPPVLLKMGILPRPPDSEPSQRCHDSNSWMCFTGPGQALVTTPPGLTKGSFVGGSSCSQSVEDGWLPGLQHFLLESAPPTPFSHHPVLDSLGLDRDNGAFDQPAEAGQGRAGQAASQHPGFRGAQWAMCGSHGPGHLRPVALATLFSRPRPPPV